MQARSQLESNRIDDVEETLAAAERFLVPLPDGEKAGALADIAAIRAELAQVLRPADRAMLSAAEGKLRLVALQVERRQAVADIIATLDSAEDLIVSVPPHHAEAVVQQIAEVRAQLAAAPRRAAAPHAAPPPAAVADPDADARERVTAELDRHLGLAESQVEINDYAVRNALSRVRDRLAEAEVARVLGAAGVAAVRARATAIEAELAAHAKRGALEVALPELAELEASVAADPLCGLELGAMSGVLDELRALKDRVEREIEPLPTTDGEVAAVAARVAIAGLKIEGALAQWNHAHLAAGIADRWALVIDDIAGWVDETWSGAPLAEPNLPITRGAIQQIRYFLEDADVVAARAASEDVARTCTEAERVWGAVTDKLAAAYAAVLAAGEAIPAPSDRSLLERPRHLATGAASSFTGTRVQAEMVARARALDDRWQAEVAAIAESRRVLFDKLAAEAEAAWPAIVAAAHVAAAHVAAAHVTASPVSPFDPAATPGTTIALAGVRNRAGWEIEGKHHSFAARIDGVLVAGNYAPHVLAALEHAWYELKLDVSDRIPWDVIAIVLGRGSIGVRTEVTLFAKSGQTVGKIEEYRPADCMQVQIVGLHAGPVAVGPG